MKWHIFFLLGCSTIFLGLSALLFLHIPPSSHMFFDYDSIVYQARALLFYHEGSFKALGTFPPLFVLGYSFFMGLCYKIFGTSINYIIFLQIIIALLCGLLIYTIAQRIFNRTVGLISFGIFSINLGFIVFAQFILAEILLVFFLLLFFERLSVFFITRKILALMAAGLMLGISILIKPIALYYICFIIPLLFFTSKKNIYTFLKQNTCFLIFFSIPISGYVIHNKMVFNEAKISDTTYINIFHHLHSKILAHLNATTSKGEKLKLAALEKKEGFDAVKKQFFDLLHHHPTAFIYCWMQDVLKTFVGLYTTNLKVLVNKNIRGGDISYFKTQGNIVSRGISYITTGAPNVWIAGIGFFEFFWSLFRYIMCLVTALYLFKTKKYFILYWFASYIFYFSIITGFDGCARYRMFFEFPLIILTALGLWVMVQATKTKKSNVF